MKKILLVTISCIMGAEITVASNGIEKNISFLNQPSNLSNLKKTAFTYSASGNCFDENTRIINLGVGLGGFGNSYYNYKGSGYSSGSTPLFSLSYEQAIPDRVGPGYIGAGVYLGFRNVYSKYDYDYFYNNYKGRYYYRNNWNAYTIAGRGAYHWDELSSDKGELYGGMMIGIQIRSYNYTSNDPDPTHYDNGRVNEGAVYGAFSIFAGGRYYFSNKVAVYAEVGSGISFLTGGLSFKF
ncbi:MAG: hypothetical protein ABI315_08750 [Bacteroidia bacterium]